MRGLILTAALATAALGGCYTTGEVGYAATYTTYPAGGYAYATTPDLVTVSPGVQVVADYDEPVFYTDGFYWRFYNGGWYRSTDYAAGWFYVDSPPVVIARIDRPYAYVHYRPRGYVSRRSVRYRPPEAIVRDHRTYGPPEAGGRDRRGPGYRPPEAGGRDRRPLPPEYGPPADVRDHRPPPPEAGGRDRRPLPPEHAPPADVRDHRAPGPPDARPAADAPAPVVRDHRAPPAKETRDHRR